jgi:hypothetical protein
MLFKRVDRRAPAVKSSVFNQMIGVIMLGEQHRQTHVKRFLGGLFLVQLLNHWWIVSANSLNMTRGSLPLRPP